MKVIGTSAMGLTRSQAELPGYQHIVMLLTCTGKSIELTKDKKVKSVKESDLILIELLLPRKKKWVFWKHGLKIFRMREVQ
jgi:hypothetical protein